MTVTIDHSTRLMQDFLPVRPVDATNDLRAIRLQDDRPLVFSIGTDDILYLIYQRDEDSGQGWTRRALLGDSSSKSVVTAFGVAQDPSNPSQFRVAAAMRDGNKSYLHVSSAVDFDAVNWTSEAAVERLWNRVQIPDKKSTVDEVRIDRSGAVLLATSTPNADARYYLYDPDTMKLSDYGLPEAGARIHQLALGSLLGQRGVFLLYDVGTTDRTLLFNSFPHPVFGRTFKRRYDVSGTINDFFVVPDADGYDTVYTCGDHVYAFADPSTREVVASGGDVTYNQIRAVREDTKVTLWLQGTSSDSLAQGLYYITNQFDLGGLSTITRWTTPQLMMKNVSVFACEKQTFISNHLFAVTSANALVHLYQDADTTLWRKDAITIEDTGMAEEISAYVVMANFKGLDLSKSNKVKISASSTVYASVNENSVLIGPRRSAWVDLNADPEVCVTIPVEDIASPEIVFTADFIQEGSLTVDPSERAMQDLADYGSGKKLQKAKDATGKRIFANGEDSPSVSSLDAVAKTTTEVVKQAKNLKASSDTAAASTASRSIPISAAANESAQHTSRAVSVRSDGDEVTMSVEHHAEPQVLSRGLFDAGGRAVGDLLHAAKEGLVDAKDWVIESASNGIKIIVKVGGQVLSFIAKKVEQVKAFIGPLFKMIGVLWDKLKKFISFLFNFGDIIECQKMFISTVNHGLDVARDNIKNLKSIMNKFADKAKTALGAGALNDQLKKALGSSSLNDQKNSSDGKSGEDPSSNASESKWMSRKVKQASTQKESGFKEIANDVAKDVVKIFTETWKDLEFSFDRMKTLITEVVTEKIGITDFVLAVLELIGAIVIDSAQNILNVIFDVLEAALTLIKDVLNYKLRIPVISSLLEKMIPGVKFEASLLEVVCFIAAVPTTVIYKLATGRAPHEDLDNKTLEDAIKESAVTDDSIPSSESDLKPEVASREFDASNYVIVSRDIGAAMSGGKTKKGKERTRGGLGIAAGSVGFLRSLTLFFKLTASDGAPKWLQVTDLVLALIAATLGLASAGLAEKTLSSSLGLTLGSFAIISMLWGLIEIPMGNPTQGWAVNTILTILGVIGVLRYAEYVAGKSNTSVEVMVLFGSLNWIMADVHHIVKEFKNPVLTAITAGMRTTFVMSSSSVNVQFSGHMI